MAAVFGDLQNPSASSVRHSLGISASSDFVFSRARGIFGVDSGCSCLAECDSNRIEAMV